MAKKKKTRKAVKAAKSKRPAAKAKKSKKAKKAVVRKAPKRKAAKKTKRPAAKKAAAKSAKRPAKKARKAKAKSRTKDVIGEGNYTASRNFRNEETSFIRNNRAEIAAKAKEAERALEGPEGDELRRADEESGARGQE